MSQLLLCEGLGHARGCSIAEYGRRFGAAASPWRSAFLAISMSQPIQFNHDSTIYMVAPYDEQWVGHEARELILDAVPEANVHISSSPTEGWQVKALPAPPENPDGRDVYRLDFHFTITVPAYVAAASRVEALALWERNFASLRREMIETALGEVSDLRRSLDVAKENFELIGEPEIDDTIYKVEELPLFR